MAMEILATLQSSSLCKLSSEIEKSSWEYNLIILTEAANC